MTATTSTSPKVQSRLGAWAHNAPAMIQRRTQPSQTRTEALTEAQLRYPHERLISRISVVVSLTLLVAAVVVISRAPAWLEHRPRIAERLRDLRGLAIAALLAPPALVLLRNGRHLRLRANSVVLSREQIPEIYATLERHCARLGLPTVPPLYLSDAGISEPAKAYSAWHTDYIVLGTKQLHVNLEEVADLYDFLLAREVGRIRMRHTSWLHELLRSYVVKIPILRAPLLRARVYSADRYGAYLVPNGIRGLIVLACGRPMLKHVRLAEYLQQVRQPVTFWARLANVLRDMPLVSQRVRALYDAKLFDEQSDLDHFEPAATSRVPSKRPSATNVPS